MDSDTLIKYRFKKLLKENNLPEVTLHDLRHSFAIKAIAVTVIANGILAADLQKIMRHST